MSEYKDHLGREFISLSTVASLLKLTKKQVGRHIRDRNMMYTKQGRRGFILKDDILNQYPHIVDRVNNIVDMDDVDDSPVNRIDNTDDVHIYTSESLTNQLEQLSSLATQFQKTFSNVRYLEQDSRSAKKSLDQLNKRVSGIKSRGVIWNIAFCVIGLSVLGLGIYGFLYFKDAYEVTQKQYKAQLVSSEAHVNALSKQYDDLASHYVLNAKTNNNYEKALKLMSLKIADLSQVIEANKIEVKDENPLEL